MSCEHMWAGRCTGYGQVSSYHICAEATGHGDDHVCACGREYDPDATSPNADHFVNVDDAIAEASAGQVPEHPGPGEDGGIPVVDHGDPLPTPEPGPVPGEDGGLPVVAHPAGAAGPYDPSEHNVDEVVAYLDDADDAEFARVIAAEKAGKARKTILDLAEDV